jgi:hypothetical protein
MTDDATAERRLPRANGAGRIIAEDSYRLGHLALGDGISMLVIIDVTHNARYATS